MNGLSVGLAGLLKSNFILLRCASPNGYPVINNPTDELRAVVAVNHCGQSMC
jgi:hypothetical protein